MLNLRRLLAGFLAVALFAALPAPGLAPLVAQSSDNTRYAAIVVDATTGEVLFGRRADSQRYPASITKVMTLYMAFEALSEGRVQLDDVLTVSPRAASQPPSKLGLASGRSIKLDDAMRATAVRSANDMAVVVAEHIGGSEARFAAMMTLKAQELGMTQTRYVNSNGLPDSRQVTSARDLAILARAVMRDFPQYYHYFGLHDWAFEGRDYRNTNGLLLGGSGYDGIKTGFTNASGYNLAASAVRDGRRLIAVVLGGRSSATRNAHVAELMNTGFEVERRRASGEPIQIAQTFFEQRGFGIGTPDTTVNAPVAYASLESEPETGSGSSEVAYAALPVAPAPRPTAPAGSGTPYTAAPRTVVAAAAPSPAPRPTAPRPTAPRSASSLTASLNGAPVERGEALNAPRRSSPPPARAATPAGRWAVQVGSFRDEAVARNWLGEVQRRFRSQFSAADRSVQSAAGWHRSRFTGLTQQAAESACETLAQSRVTCMVVRPQ